MKWVLILLVFALFSCENTPQLVEEDNTINSVQIVQDSIVKESTNQQVSLRLNKIGLINIQDFDSNILIDLRYSTENNFMKRQLYDTLKSAYLQREVVERLSECQDYLDSVHPGYHLLVLDAVRPLQVQQEMWKSLDSVPTSIRGKYVSNPKFGSVHNFGAAVDLTIVNDKGEELDMGAGYDDFRDIAFPSKESHFFEIGLLTTKQIKNRRLLRKVMRHGKFYVIPSEWWHFNAFSRPTASKKFQCLLNESGESDWREVLPKIKSQSDSVISPE